MPERGKASELAQKLIAARAASGAKGGIGQAMSAARSQKGENLKNAQANKEKINLHANRGKARGKAPSKNNLASPYGL